MVDRCVISQQFDLGRGYSSRLNLCDSISSSLSLTALGAGLRPCFGCYLRRTLVHRNTNVDLKLLKELHVVFKEHTQVVNAVAQHGQTLYTQAEGKAGELIWVNIARGQHVRVHHAATAYF